MDLTEHDYIVRTADGNIDVRDASEEYAGNGTILCHVQASNLRRAIYKALQQPVAAGYMDDFGK